MLEMNFKCKIAPFLETKRGYLKYRGKGSNLHAQSAPDPKSGVSTNSTTAAYIKITKKGHYYLPLFNKYYYLDYFIKTIFLVNTLPPAVNL